MFKRLILLFVFGSIINVFSQYKILLLGDSITNGLYGQNYGFRYYLYNHLQSIAFPFEFVGSNGVTPYWGFFANGAQTEWFLPVPAGTGVMPLTNEMNTTEPNLIMIHLGTNDVDHGDINPYTYDNGLSLSLNTKTGQLANLISFILQWKFGVRGDCVDKIFISKIIDKTGYASRVVEFNEGVERIFNDSEAGLIPSIPSGSLKLVDHYTSFDMATMIAGDGIHPNESGYQNMGFVNFDALRTLPLYLVSVSDDTINGVMNFMSSGAAQVQVIDGFDTGQSNVAVHFEVISGDAEISGETEIDTDNNGTASVDIQFGNTGISMLRATANGLIQGSVDIILNAIEGVSISGDVSYVNTGTPIPGVDVIWEEYNNIRTASDPQGEYELSALLPGSEISVKIQKDPWSDIGPWIILSYDAAMVAQNVVGLRQLEGKAFQAADVNQDGIIDMYDASQIARAVAGLPLPQNVKVGTWQFEPDSLSYSNLWDDLQNQDISGYVIGDIHTVWSFDGVSKQNDDYNFYVDPVATHDSVLTIPCTIHGSDVSAFDFNVSYPSETLRFISVEQRVADEPFTLNTSHVSSGQIKIGGYRIHPLNYNKAEVYLRFINKTSSPFELVVDPIYLNDQKMESHILDGNSDQVLAKNKLSLLPNYPNPFNGETTFRFYLPEEEHVTMIVYNQMGQRVVQLHNGIMGQGLRQIKWNGCDQKGRSVASGVYIFKLMTHKHQKVQKMQLIQ